MCIRDRCGTGTNVANVTLISTTASVFTLFFSVVFLSDAFSLLKLACALLNFGGIALVLAADGSSSSSENASERKTTEKKSVKTEAVVEISVTFATEVPVPHV